MITATSKAELALYNSMVFYGDLNRKVPRVFQDLTQCHLAFLKAILDRITYIYTSNLLAASVRAKSVV